jgi:FixJ family two-component response regulator
MVLDTLAGRTKHRPRLLLVEDDAGVRRSLQLLFRGRGFDVQAYATGAALLADPLVADEGCFVADYRLDETDGIEVLAHLRARGWRGSAVLITAYPTAEIRERALRSGFDAVLEKPFREHVLGDTVARLTGASHGLGRE